MGGKEARERRRQKRTAISQPTSVISSEFESSNRLNNIGKTILNDRKNSIQKKKKKKIEKPKHLKRKLEQLSQLEEKETREAMRENLMKKQEALERQKAKRSLAFQTKIKAAVGDAFFNKEVFNSLVSHGVSKSKIVEAIIHESTAPTLSQDHCSNIEVSQTNFQKETTNKIVSDDDVASTGIIKPVESCSEDDDDDHSTSELSSCKKKRTRGRGHLKKKKKRDNANDKKEVPTTETDKDRITTEETDKHTSPAEETDKDTNLIPVPTATATSESIKQTNKDSRRCIGRKPVTDFVIGETYRGKVVYIKTFGAFVDIGCHSDAFVHISRVHDDFVDDINNVLKENDEVNARVVEIDRKKKRITLSLQSEAMVEREQKSLTERSNRMQTKSKKKEKTLFADNNIVESKKCSDNQPTMTKVSIATTQSDAPLSKADLKRARKLERRAERRIQQSS